jgi:hypothetical protein
MVIFPKLFAASEVITRIDGISPSLASWNAKHHPDQVRLRTYLDDLRLRAGGLPEGKKLYLDLKVDVGDARKLIRHHDVENYLTPLFGRTWFDHRQFPLVSGSKHVGGGSSLTIGTVNEIDSAVLRESWHHLALNAGSSPTTKAWKERINSFVELAQPLMLPPNQPVEFHMSFRCSTRRNWVSLWKPAGDALSPILGYQGSNKYNPNDDRITSITFHRVNDDKVGNDVHVGFWWRVSA